MLHVVHVAGTRMIKSGVDGLSRGETGEGVMQGKEMLSFIPLHLDAMERSNGAVHTWVESWWLSELKLVKLTPDGWYDRVFDEGCFLWVPPPAAADAAVEQLCRNYQLHEGNFNIIIVPRLFTSRWREQLVKVEDLLVTIPFNDSFWPKSQNEPLILAIVFPFHSTKPWKLRGTTLLVNCERELQEVWEKNISLGGDILRKLLLSTRTLGTMPRDMVRKLLSLSQRGKICHS